MILSAPETEYQPISTKILALYFPEIIIITSENRLYRSTILYSTQTNVPKRFLLDIGLELLKACQPVIEFTQIFELNLNIFLSKPRNVFSIRYKIYFY